MAVINEKKSIFPIIGIGASAGGLDSFESFFQGMPESKPNMAFILVQHLSPDYASSLVDILSRYSKMQLFQVEDRMTVEPGCIYIIPPNNDMALKNGKLHLYKPSRSHPFPTPIDFLFHSLATELGSQAVGIVLSGTGSDGTLGITEIHQAGGLVMAESLDSAEYDGMPRSAIATGYVDYVISPKEMAGQLLELTANPSDSRGKTCSLLTKKESASLDRIFSILLSETGHDFSNYKKNTIYRRIQRRLATNEIPDLDAYCEYLQRNTKEVEMIFHEILIGVTNFFRDPGMFTVLEEQVIPTIFSNRKPGESIRVWVPGCSTGEEAYSIAILIKEYMTKSKVNNEVQIYATDIDGTAIAKARAGIYPGSIAKDITAERLAAYFNHLPDKKAYKINKSIRDMLIFSEQSVIKDPPFSNIDLLSCRNLLIYMNSWLQEQLIPLYHYSLRSKGFLVLGTSESLSKHEDLFTTIDRKQKIFQRKEGSVSMKTPITGSQTRKALAFDAPGFTPRLNDGPSLTFQPLREIAEQALLKELKPAGVLVKGNGDILYYHGDTGNFLQPAPGEAAVSNILKMAREGLAAELTLALSKAVKSKEIVHQKDLKVKINGYFSPVNLTVKPILPRSSNALEEPLYMVILEKQSDAPLAFDRNDPLEASCLPSSENDVSLDLLKREIHTKEEYLKNANEELSQSNEDLGAANQELQSINEELQSANEELVTSREELQSLNEELSTVNAEMQCKISELSQVNNDMNNLLAGTNIATIFVNHQICITRFTPSTTQIINLIDGDIGRPLYHVVSNLLDYTSLRSDIQQVLDNLIPIERELQTADNKWFTMRIQPYRTIENVIEGAVITFIDISNAKALAFSAAFYRRLFEEAKEGLLILDSETGKIKDANSSVLKLLGFGAKEFIGKDFWQIPQFRDIAANQKKFQLLQKESCVHYESLSIESTTGVNIKIQFTSHLYQEGTRGIIHCHIRELAGPEPVR